MSTQIKSKIKFIYDLLRKEPLVSVDWRKYKWPDS